MMSGIGRPGFRCIGPIRYARIVFTSLNSEGNAAAAAAEMTAHLKSLARYMKSQERPKRKQAD
jgi:hypothetical protein